MAFRGEMNNGSRAVLLQQRGHQRRVADVAVDEDVIGIGLERGQIGGIARISKLVQIDQLASGLFSRGEPVQNKVRADEAGTSSDKNGSAAVYF
jgi:hypothetical protein